MFAFKKNYFLIIENINDINLNNIKENNKFIIIYRNSKSTYNLSELLKFRKKCKVKRIKFFTANNQKLCCLLNSDGIYISASNKSFKPLHLKRRNMDIIGSAHNILEIKLKKKQGCDYIIVSKLFKVDYAQSSKFLEVIRFNYLAKFYKNIIPLGGIKLTNLNKLKMVKSKGIAIMSGIKKKPAIANRLF